MNSFPIMKLRFIIISILMTACTAKSQVKVGDKVPVFTLRDQNGKTFNLSDHLGKKYLVIYFYPKDETKGCTAEACTFRDSYSQFQNNDAEVIGISSDTQQSHKKFAEHHNLPFTLLSDPGGKTRKLFGVPRSMMGLIPGRVTYVVDKQGIIRLIFNSQVKFDEHATEALNIIKAEEKN